MPVQRVNVDSRLNSLFCFVYTTLENEQGFGGGGPFQGGFQSNVDIDPHDLFEQLFGAQAGGRQRRPRGPRPGQDLQLRMKLSFLEAVSGFAIIAICKAYPDDDLTRRNAPPRDVCFSRVLALCLLLVVVIVAAFQFYFWNTPLP